MGGIYLLMWSNGDRKTYPTLLDMADDYLAYGDEGVEAYCKAHGICWPLFWTLESVEDMIGERDETFT
jgi:hypothetical protein